MLFGMDTFTFVHVALSLVAIAAGVVAVLGFTANAALPGTTALFLATTVLTNVTGFGFPFSKLLPSHIIALTSLVVLGTAIYALYGAHLKGAWRWVYVVTASLALYFNVFVLVVQLFLKVPALHALAPTMGDPAFIIAQTAVIGLFIVLGWLGVRRFHGGIAVPLTTAAPV